VLGEAGAAAPAAKPGGDGEQERDRVDRGNVESSDRMLEGEPWLRPLLRRGDLSSFPLERQALASRARCRECRASRGAAWSAAPLATASDDLRLDFVERVFEVMETADQHTFQILTKRHERMAALAPLLRWPANVWMGVSIENRRWVERADCLREVPAAVRFISAEPLLGPLDGLNLSDIDWLIAGGESGRGHRPVRAEWLRDLRDACEGTGVAFFFKQWGGPRSKSGGRNLDGREHSDMPRIRAA
jgi:protein gp37